ncbi:uncharacterized protein LOC142999323 [Genypterus blacodes]|uniref:uncharacterized protein LOC142999323 n=1 Tax=Genypterus blacodes TaxID=154954 RepID=UPI003F76DA9C
MTQHHVTIQAGGQRPAVQRCSQCCVLYHCPLCSPDVFKPSHRCKVLTHLRCHLSRAVHFKGYDIYKCNLGCRPQAHFHCFCTKLFLNRNQFLHHLNTKHHSLPPVDPSVCLGVTDNDGDASAGVTNAGLSDADASLTCDCALSLSAAEDETAWTSDNFSNVDAAFASEGPSDDVQMSSHPAKAGPKERVTCPQCNLGMNKRSAHMKRKHFNRAALSSLIRDPSNAPIELLTDVERTDRHLAPTPVQLEILTQLRIVREQQSRILQLLQKLARADDDGEAPDSTPDVVAAMFPIADESGLADLEMKLGQSPDWRNRILNFFGNTEGLPIDQTVRRILERMLSNTFAKRMTWKGENNTASFASSCLVEIINDAVRRNSLCARAADTAVAYVMKRWLQQAGECDEGAKEGGERSEEHQ